MKFPILAIMFAATALLTVAGHASAQDFEIVVDSAGNVTYVQGGPPTIEEVENVPDNRSAWRIDNPTGALRGSVTFDGFWNLSNPRQVLPKLSGAYFTEFYGEEIEEAREDVDFTNLTGTVERQVFLFSIARNEATSARTLTFEKDTAPPAFTLGNITNVTHFSFLISTTTDEPAFGNLQIRPASGGEPVENPTPQPARRQTFPVQGLKPNTTYEFWIDFWDFSHNYVRSLIVRVNTTLKPVFPPPVVLETFPADNSTHSTPPLSVYIRVTSPNAALRTGDVRIFVDQREVTPNLTFDGEIATHVPERPFSAGDHPVTAEITDEVGGFLRVKWRFTVVEKPVPGVEPPFFLLVIAGALLAARGRRVR